MTGPFYERHGVTVHAGDALDVLCADQLGYDYRLGYAPPAIPDNSVHAVVCDPPYGLEFMGRDWDRFRPGGKQPQIGAADGTPFRRTTGTPSWSGSGNPRCRNCGGTKYDRTRPTGCQCDAPSFPNEAAQHMRAYQAWCEEVAYECLRVLKPGGYMLAFGATRTFHRLAAGIEDAGFEIRDTIMCWINSQGMPKGLNVGKAIDARGARDAEAVAMLKAELRRVFDTSGMTLGELNERCGFEASGYLRTSSTWATLFPPPEKWARMREVIGGDDQLGEKFRAAEREVIRERTMTQGGGTALQMRMGEVREVRADITAPATDAARQWEGWNTALAPAQEPIVVARKPLAGTVAVNVLQHGVGAFNIDSCKVDSGRWPSNVVFVHLPECGPDDTTPCAEGCPVQELDRQSGTLTSGANPTRRSADKFRDAYGEFRGQAECVPARGADTGGASRFYPVFRYEAKAPKDERPQVAGVSHPTVKPLALMRWLVRLVCPPGGTVLDWCAGTGTTGQAARAEGMRAVLIENHAPYLPLIRARLDARPRQTEPAAAVVDDGPLDLLDLLNEDTA